VPGPGAFGIRVDNAALQSLPGTAAASVVVTITNDGTRLGKPALSVSLTGPNGYQRTAKRPLDTILPGDTIGYPMAWPDVLQPGDYTITVHATPGPASPTDPGTAAVRTVSAHLGTALAGVPSPGVVTPAPVSHHSKSGFPTLIVVVLVAIAGVGGGLLLGRRSHGSTPPAPEPAQVLATEGSAKYPVDR